MPELSHVCNPYIFNPLHWHIMDALSNEDIRYVLVYGGSSAAKTYSIVQALIIDGDNGNYDTMIFQKFGSTIKDSVEKDFNGIINAFDLTDDYDSTLHAITRKENKLNEIKEIVFRFRGLDDSEKTKGMSKFKKVYANELNLFEKADWNQIKKRLRGQAGQQIIADWNPVDEEHWIKKDLIDKDTWTDLPLEIEDCPSEYSALDYKHSFKKINAAGDTILIKTTYRDNFWVAGHPVEGYGYYDRHVIADFEKDKNSADPVDNNQYRIYANGEWGKSIKGAEYYPTFADKHTDKVDFIPNLPVHLTYDFNLNPYMTLVSCQIEETVSELNFRFFKEYCYENPKNTTEDVTMGFVEDFGYMVNDIFYYGDAMGTRGVEGFGDEVTRFEDVRKVLGHKVDNDYSDRTTRINPGILKRRKLINQILKGEMYINGKKVNIIFDIENCPETIKDFRHVKQGNNGKLKEMVEHPITKKKYEKYGHTSDAVEYLICYVLEEYL